MVETRVARKEIGPISFINAFYISLIGCCITTMIIFVIYHCWWSYVICRWFRFVLFGCLPIFIVAVAGIVSILEHRIKLVCRAFSVALFMLFGFFMYKSRGLLLSTIMSLALLVIYLFIDVLLSKIGKNDLREGNKTYDLPRYVFTYELYCFCVSSSVFFILYGQEILNIMIKSLAGMTSLIRVFVKILLHLPLAICCISLIILLSYKATISPIKEDYRQGEAGGDYGQDTTQDKRPDYVKNNLIVAQTTATFVPPPSL